MRLLFSPAPHSVISRQNETAVDGNLVVAVLPRHHVGRGSRIGQAQGDGIVQVGGFRGSGGALPVAAAATIARGAVENERCVVQNRRRCLGNVLSEFRLGAPGGVQGVNGGASGEIRNGERLGLEQALRISKERSEGGGC